MGTQFRERFLSDYPGSMNTSLRLIPIWILCFASCSTTKTTSLCRVDKALLWADSIYEPKNSKAAYLLQSGAVTEFQIEIGRALEAGVDSQALAESVSKRLHRMRFAPDEVKAFIIDRTMEIIEERKGIRSVQESRAEKAGL